MNRKTVDESDVRAVSQEKKVPLEKVLSRFVLLEFARLISESKFSSRLLCINPGAIISDVDFGIRTGNTVLKYHYILNPDETFDRASFTYVLKNAVKYVENTSVDFSWQTENDGDRLKINIQGSLGDLMVPFCVYVAAGTQILRPEKIEISDPIDPKDKFKINIYPASSRIASNLVVILRDLDFVTDMGCFESIYQTLKTMEFDARHLQKSLFEMMESENVIFDDERFEIVKNYTSSSHMKKRWVSYQKKKKKELVPWENVIRMIVGAFSPIWEAQKAGEVFIGDWMAELGKYL